MSFSTVHIIILYLIFAVIPKCNGLVICKLRDYPDHIRRRNSSFWQSINIAFTRPFFINWKEVFSKTTPTHHPHLQHQKPLHIQPNKKKSHLWLLFFHPKSNSQCFPRQCSPYPTSANDTSSTNWLPTVWHWLLLLFCAHVHLLCARE